MPLKEETPVKVNVGGLDRGIRILVALIAAYFGFTTGGTLGYVLYAVAAVALLTGAIGWCGLYTLLGVNTCPVKKG